MNKYYVFIEQRFYDNGKAQARMHTIKDPIVEKSELYDSYLDRYNSIFNFLDELEGLETDDMAQIISDFKDGKWVDITNYC